LSSASIRGSITTTDEMEFIVPAPEPAGLAAAVYAASGGLGGDGYRGELRREGKRAELRIEKNYRISNGDFQGGEGWRGGAYAQAQKFGRRGPDSATRRPAGVGSAKNKRLTA